MERVREIFIAGQTGLRVSHLRNRVWTMRSGTKLFYRVSMFVRENPNIYLASERGLCAVRFGRR